VKKNEQKRSTRPFLKAAHMYKFFELISQIFFEYPFVPIELGACCLQRSKQQSFRNFFFCRARSKRIFNMVLRTMITPKG